MCSRPLGGLDCLVYRVQGFGSRAWVGLKGLGLGFSSSDAGFSISGLAFVEACLLGGSGHL